MGQDVTERFLQAKAGTATPDDCVFHADRNGVFLFRQRRDVSFNCGNFSSYAVDLCSIIYSDDSYASINGYSGMG